MADIDLQKKRGMNVWPWIGALVALILIIWGIAEWAEPEPESEVTMAPTPTITPGTTPEPIGTTPGVTIGDIVGNPTAYVDESFPGSEVEVVDVPTDRGFWIEDEGTRLFAILIDQPREVPVDINPGQTLRIDEGMLRDRTFLPEIPGDPLDADTETIAENQEVFLVVDEENIEILATSDMRPGGDMAPGTGMPGNGR